MFSFICCLFAFVKVVRLGTKRPTLSPGSTSLASRPCYPARVSCRRSHSQKDTHKPYMLLHYPLDKSAMYTNHVPYNCFVYRAKYTLIHLHLFLFLSRCSGDGRPRDAATLLIHDWSLQLALGGSLTAATPRDVFRLRGL